MDLQLSYFPIAAAADHNGPVPITKVRDAASGFQCFVYQCSLREDFDGAPDAYGSNNPNPVEAQRNPDTRLQVNVNGRDGIGSATNRPPVFARGEHEFSYVGLFATDQTTATRLGLSIDRRPFLEARRKMAFVPHNVHGRVVQVWQEVQLAPDAEGFFPVIQGAGQPAQGHFVSTTSIAANPNLPEWNQNRWVNANVIPYAAYAGWWGALGVSTRDIGVAFSRDTGAATAFVFADTGSGHVGEVSHRALDKLKKDGGDDENKYNFIVFPGSGAGVGGLLSQEAAVENRARDLVRRFNAIDGAEELIALLALDANLTSLKRWARGARDADGAEIDAGGRYDTALMALSGYGFSGG